MSRRGGAVSRRGGASAPPTHACASARLLQAGETASAVRGGGAGAGVSRASTRGLWRGAARERLVSTTEPSSAPAGVRDAAGAALAVGPPGDPWPGAMGETPADGRGPGSGVVATVRAGGGGSCGPAADGGGAGAIGDGASGGTGGRTAALAGPGGSPPAGQVVAVVAGVARPPAGGVARVGGMGPVGAAPGDAVGDGVRISRWAGASVSVVGSSVVGSSVVGSSVVGSDEMAPAACAPSWASSGGMTGPCAPRAGARTRAVSCRGDAILSR